MNSVDFINDQIEYVAQEVTRQQDNRVKAAILGTDWRETAVLRLIWSYPQPQVGMNTESEALEEQFTIKGPELHVERYDNQAPPVQAHLDPHRRVEVQTITLPLLERIANDYTEVAEILNAALTRN